MKLERGRLFERDLSKLRDKQLVTQLEKSLRLLQQNPNHPSLHCKRLICKRADNLFSVRVSKGYRLLFLEYEEKLLLYRLLDHDRYDRLSKGC